jgi:hypothetical protein
MPIGRTVEEATRHQIEARERIREEARKIAEELETGDGQTRADRPS